MADDKDDLDEATDRVLTVPNLISVIRLLLVPVFAILIATHHDVWAIVVLAVSGASDWLDGVAARRLHQVSKLGQVLDPAADRLFILVTLLGLALRDIIPWWLVAVLLAREVAVGVTLPMLARRGYGPLPVNFIGKAATLTLMYAFPLLLLGQIDGWVGTVAGVAGWAFAWWGVGLYWWAGFLYLRGAARLLRSTDGPDGAQGATA
ncbi:CDP-diacylglycerol--glycerol-3-phosphate 3-phosphatidyltransferase [Luteimicrobium album]|uniref:CDP-diacylglycerol--glycerol-3-phosphate 3-phosphatidyltransferase n=1 Tax=Luteimicrobium album TaxID=1054550 RepID=A0ABQ6I5A0_9MICO|nr:CDP-alcohol phosphatidyltransferase family protein [Luteimicrobium album]GMA25948.1 CDP-diacylglycerol--glycerol-3-phosphate 3-phosphatidyltransferase [Luteimicrobium album]